MSEAVSTAGFVPKLRFPRFSDGWQTTHLGSAATLLTGRVGDETCTPLSITSGVGLVSQQEKFGRLIAGGQYKNYLRLEPGDFAYNKSSTKEFPQGQVARYSGSEPAAVPSSIFTCLRSRPDHIDAEFLRYLFSYNIHGRFLKQRLSVGARAHGSLNVADTDFLAVPLPVPSGPKSLAEQRKIAEFLQSLDELIALATQKFDALTRYKKGLLQQLFPAEGENFPRLRFPRFAAEGEWQSLNLVDVARISSGNTPPRSRPDYFKGGIIPWVKTMDLNNSHITHTQELVTEAANLKLNPPGSVLVAMYGGFNQIGRTGVLTMPAAARTALGVLKPKEGILDSGYLLLWLNANVEQWRIVAASSRKDANITSSDVASFPIALPSIEEQRFLSRALYDFDSALFQTKHKLTSLHRYKAALLQRLFPAIDEVEG